MSNPIKKSIAYGSHTLTLETGEIGRQANGAVVASLGDTVVLVSCVMAKQRQAEFSAAHGYWAGHLPPA